MKNFKEYLYEMNNSGFQIINFSQWVHKSECFGQNDLNDLKVAYERIRGEYESIFDEDFDAEFDVQKDKDDNIIIINKIGEDGKDKLLDILRNLWEDELNQEEDDNVVEATAVILDI